MKYLSYAVMIYMLLALIWWSVLLSKKNDIIYNKSIQLTTLTHQNDPSGLEKSIQEIKSEFDRNKYMIIGEGCVFGISLIIGIWFIQKAYLHEVTSSKKQNNFLLSITHELKSPIASINLITETILKRKLPENQLIELHENILSESMRLEKLINNLLLTNRLNNEYPYNFEKVDIAKIIEKSISKLAFQYQDASISTHFPSEKIIIDGDEEALFSIFINLIENAVKYSSENAIVDIWITQSPQNIEMVVTDNGVGIANIEKNKIFQQFYRIGNEDTRESKGTGLGLYIVEKITKAHQGKIKVEDHLPKGTKFTIQLPKQQFRK